MDRSVGMDASSVCSLILGRIVLCRQQEVLMCQLCGNHEKPCVVIEIIAIHAPYRSYIFRQIGMCCTSADWRSLKCCVKNCAKFLKVATVLQLFSGGSHCRRFANFLCCIGWVLMI